MSKRKGKVFIDTNILFYADSFKLDNVFEWIDSLYEEVFIHTMVLNEILSPNIRNKVQSYIDKESWKLFDPDDDSTLSDELYAVYESKVDLIKEAFRQLNVKKQKEGRRLKGTNDLGEIHCLAAALLLRATIICSNDSDIQEVIDDNQLEVASDDESVNLKIEQDSLVDFSYFIILHKIAEQSIVRKFLKTYQKDRISQLDSLLLESEQAIQN